MAEHTITLLTKEEVAKALRCSTKTIERRVKRGMYSYAEGTGGKLGRPLFDPKSIPALRRVCNG